MVIIYNIIRPVIFVIILIESTDKKLFIVEIEWNFVGLFTVIPSKTSGMTATHREIISKSY